MINGDFCFIKTFGDVSNNDNKIYSLLNTTSTVNIGKLTMGQQRGDILGTLDVSREEVFASPTNSVILIPKGEHTPCGEVYFRNNKFGVRFGDYKPSTVKKELQ